MIVSESTADDFQVAKVIELANLYAKGSLSIKFRCSRFIWDDFEWGLIELSRLVCSMKLLLNSRFGTMSMSILSNGNEHASIRSCPSAKFNLNRIQ